MLGKGCEDSYPPIEGINSDNAPLVTNTGNSDKAETFNDFFLSHNNLEIRHQQFFLNQI